MYRLWSLLFLSISLLVLATFWLAASGWQPLQQAWLPENLSRSGTSIDDLYYLVHWVCAVVLIVVTVVLLVVIWKFGSRSRERASSFRNNVWLETIWTVIPAAILVWIAVYQHQLSGTAQQLRPMVTIDGVEMLQPPLVRVVAKQFGWEFHYAGADQAFDTADDISTENLMFVPDDELIVIRMTSRDVIHGFAVPRLRLKQDVVPGREHFATFRPARTGEMDIVCSELCGWGHYRMNAKLKIVSRQQFRQWLDQQNLQQHPMGLVGRDSGP